MTSWLCRTSNWTPITSIARRSAAFVIVGLVLSSCGARIPLLGGPSSTDGLGITQKIDTIKVCAQTLNDIRAAEALAAKAQTGGPSFPSTSVTSELAAKFKARAAANPGLPISKSLDSLGVSLEQLDRSRKGTPAQMSTAASRVGSGLEKVVSRCAQVGA